MVTLIDTHLIPLKYKHWDYSFWGNMFNSPLKMFAFGSTSSEYQFGPGAVFDRGFQSRIPRYRGIWINYHMITCWFSRFWGEIPQFRGDRGRVTPLSFPVPFLLHTTLSGFPFPLPYSSLSAPAPTIPSFIRKYCIGEVRSPETCSFFLYIINISR